MLQSRGRVTIFDCTPRHKRRVTWKRFGHFWHERRLSKKEMEDFWEKWHSGHCQAIEPKRRPMASDPSFLVKLYRFAVNLLNFPAKRQDGGLKARVRLVKPTPTLKRCSHPSLLQQMAEDGAALAWEWRFPQSGQANCTPPRIWAWSSIGGIDVTLLIF